MSLEILQLLLFSEIVHGQFLFVLFVKADCFTISIIRTLICITTLKRCIYSIIRTCFANTCTANQTSCACGLNIQLNLYNVFLKMCLQHKHVEHQNATDVQKKYFVCIFRCICLFVLLFAKASGTYLHM